jgi:hypothetical protein
LAGIINQHYIKEEQRFLGPKHIEKEGQKERVMERRL